MNRYRRILLAVIAVLVLAAVSALAWRFAAVPTALAQVPDSRVGQGDPGAAAPAPEAPLPGGPAFLSVDPGAFHPTQSNCIWGIYDGWKLFGDCTFMTGLSLPDNVTINKLVVVFLDIFDDPGLDVDVSLWRHDPVTEESVEMARVISSGGSEDPRYLVDESIVEPVVDQQQYTYSLKASPGMIPGYFTMLLGVRIDYGYNVGLPLMLNDQ